MPGSLMEQQRQPLGRERKVVSGFEVEVGSSLLGVNDMAVARFITGREKGD